MAAQKKYPDDLRERAVKIVLEIREREGKGQGELARVARQLGVHPEALRSWVKQAEIDGGSQPGTTSDDKKRIAELEREVRELRRRTTARGGSQASCGCWTRGSSRPALRTVTCSQVRWASRFPENLQAICTCPRDFELAPQPGPPRPRRMRTRTVTAVPGRRMPRYVTTRWNPRNPPTRKIRSSRPTPSLTERQWARPAVFAFVDRCPLLPRSR
jgi:transposase